MNSRIGLRHETGRFGDLDCSILTPSSGRSPRFCTILCHGFGAPATDLVALGPELAAMCPEQAGELLFLFPHAPLGLDEYGLPGGRAWWMIDIERFQRSLERPDDLNRLRREIPVGMPESSRLLQGLVAAVQRQTGISLNRVLLGGFSQGAMVATDVALRLADPPAGLCIFSGTLVAEDDWRALARKRGPLAILQSHGRFDPILPFSGAEALRDLFVDAGLNPDFVPFDGPHTIPFEALERLAALIRNRFRDASNPEVRTPAGD